MADDSRIFFEASSSRKRLKISNNSFAPHTFNSDIFEKLSEKESVDLLNKFGDCNRDSGVFDCQTSHSSHTFQDEENGLRINLGMHPNCDSDLTNGGDSGFNELASPESMNDFDRDEPDSSTCNNVGSVNFFEDNENNGLQGDDESDGASDISDLSGFSELSKQSRSPQSRNDHLCWIQKQMMSGIEPRTLLEYFVPPGHKMTIPDHVDDWTIWEIVYSVVNDPPRRQKLKDKNSFDDVLHLITTCKKIIVLTGAGVSVSCGIPDFRSRDGIYARLAKDFPDLPDPQSMFDIQYFKKDPRPFYKFAKEIFPGSFEPSTCHKFIKLLEEREQLLRNYTQNIDTLERVAGMKNVVECHGSFATASCLNCSHKVDSSEIKEDVFNQTIPYCSKCSSDANEQSILKPDIVFFGEGLPEEFHTMIENDKDECDLLIVIGSSLKVRPVALIPNSLPSHIPQILINRESLPHCTFDIELLGDCDVIINEICRRLGSGWNHLCYNDVTLTETCGTNLKNDLSGECRSDPCDSTSYPHKEKKATDLTNLSENARESVFTIEADPDSTVVKTIEEKTESTSYENLGFSKKSSKLKVPTCKENTYLFCPPNQYIFSGAEISDGETESNKKDAVANGVDYVEDEFIRWADATLIDTPPTEVQELESSRNPNSQESIDNCK